MQRATRIATHILAWIAVAYLVLWVIVYSSIGFQLVWPLIFLPPAVAALAAVMRIKHVINGDVRMRDLAIALGLALGVFLFGNSASVELRGLIHAPGHYWKNNALGALATGLPAILSAWVGVAFLIAGLRALARRDRLW